MVAGACAATAVHAYSGRGASVPSRQLDRNDKSQLDECGKAAQRAVPLARNIARIVPVGVLLADASVLAVNDQFAVLVFCSVPALPNRFVLGDVCRTLLSADVTRPSVSAGDYVYVWHQNLLRLPEAAVPGNGRARWRCEDA